MKKIIVVASYFYPKIGGLENYAYLLAKKLQESGEYSVSIITSNYAGKGYKKESIDGMTVHRLPVSFKLSNTPINVAWYDQIKNIFKDEKPDLIHIHAPVPYLPDLAAAAAGNTPVVLTYHSGSLLKGKWPVDVLLSAYESIFLKKLFKRADAVVAVSQAFAKHTFPQFADKICFIPTGVDLSRFAKTPLPLFQTVTFVGRIERTSSWKGIDQLLKAFVLVLQKYPDAKLELVGGGDAIDDYKKQAKTFGIASSVIFTGPLLGQSMVDAYKRSSMVVLPSTSDAEAFSVALVEAMASGRPIIGTTIGGTPQVIQEGKNGLLVPPKDPQALAAAVNRVLGDRAFAQSLADYGAQMAQGFSWDIQAKKYADLFELVLANKK